jgi:hypothetical protein
MTHCWLERKGVRAAFLFVLFTGVPKFPAQPVDVASIVSKIDEAVKARVDGIEMYTDTEHYAVFRNGDETHPVAEMTVKTTYKKETGKSYQILSETGSTVIRSLVLHAILENEQRVNKPGIREGSWITTANYQMQVKPGGVQKVEGRDCYAIALTPRRAEPYLVVGTLWVDAQNGEIVKLEGKASRSSSLLTGPTEMARHYIDIDGFGEATHARATSDSFLFGKAVVTIDYTGYQIQRRTGP